MDKNAPYCEKHYVDNGKTIKIIFDENQQKTDEIINYAADGFDIEVRKFILDGVVSIDSTYCKRGKEIRNVHIYSGDKSISTSEYDEKGNIILEIEKSKTEIKVSNEELDEMIQLYIESKEKEKWL